MGDGNQTWDIVDNTSDPQISQTPSTNFSDVVEHPCQWILYADIGDSRVRIWDVIILIPNALFLLFLVWRLRIVVAKLRNVNSPIFTAFYGLVFLVAVISVLRCIVSMTVNASILAGDVADKMLWLILRFFLLATEMSVIIFGLAFGHLDIRTSIQRVLVVTSCIALLYSIIQGTLEFLYPDQRFHVDKKSTSENFDIFAHGGMIFWFTSSLIFFVVYSVIFLLPYTKLKERLSLPSKRSFYYYAAFLAALNLIQAVGSCLIYYMVQNGLCVVDLTTYIYFTCFDPLVYYTFLKDFFKAAQPNILFSYKAQVDDVPEEDIVSLPYQGYTNGHAGADDSIMSGSYDSTHFDRHSNPDLAGSIQ
ncbi:transmembrane protein adipocyte-associated 1 homolog [Liolophura sinensis]|uniref:transmembrane protein adipocyte-associated 1 homolog n=1 Tax=Liolophura sinensis TaxID=3198878 RepID=UPI003158A6FB